MAGFRRSEVLRAQMVLWSRRLDDAIPPDHPVRHFESLLRADAFSETFAAWEREYVLAEGKPPYHPRGRSGVPPPGCIPRRLRAGPMWGPGDPSRPGVPEAVPQGRSRPAPGRPSGSRVAWSRCQ